MNFIYFREEVLQNNKKREEYEKEEIAYEEKLEAWRAEKLRR